jgi:hypothetical protein
MNSNNHSTMWAMNEKTLRALEDAAMAKRVHNIASGFHFHVEVITQNGSQSRGGLACNDNR